MNAYHQLLEAARLGEHELAPITRLLGMKLVSWTPGLARLEMEVGEQHHSPMGFVHGGIFCDLADAAFGCAVASTVEPGLRFTTVTLNISYFRPVKAGRIAAEARVIRMGRRTCFADCDVICEGQLAAKATTTLMLLKPVDG